MSERPKKASLAHRLYHGETAINFIGRRRIWFALSGLVILAGVISLLTQGLNLGIEFKGGTSWEVEAPGVSVAEARDAVRPFGLANATIQVVGGDRIRVAGGNQPPQEQAEVSRALADLARVDVTQVSVNDVGPTWGQAVTNKARNALVVFFVLITAYISLRFEWKMAIAALVAVVHDILVTVGVYSISRFEVTPATVVAFLTILGYSMYDTIVVFDKVEENAKGLSATGRLTYSDTVNLSMNQVLMRSLNTSISSILPIISLLVIGGGILGATTLNDFGLALLVGLLTSAYSSLCTASPVLAILKEREPRYAGVRQRLEAKGGTGVLTPAAAAA
ncbi:MAG: protein translocase subunit SecF, partial [Actinomycetota bacterium]|nr:protein translocase subunit SecF [Actinomycetota bacterium]